MAIAATTNGVDGSEECREKDLRLSLFGSGVVFNIVLLKVYVDVKATRSQIYGVV